MELKTTPDQSIYNSTVQEELSKEDPISVNSIFLNRLASSLNITDEDTLNIVVTNCSKGFIVDSLFLELCAALLFKEGIGNCGY